VVWDDLVEVCGAYVLDGDLLAEGGEITKAEAVGIYRRGKGFVVEVVEVIILSQRRLLGAEGRGAGLGVDDGQRSEQLSYLFGEELGGGKVGACTVRGGKGDVGSDKGSISVKASRFIIRLVFLLGHDGAGHLEDRQDNAHGDKTDEDTHQDNHNRLYH